MKKIALLFVLVVLVSGCVGQSTTISSSTTDEDIGAHDTAPEGSNLVEIDMLAKQWEFIPSTIEVNEGDRVILHITSDDVTHGIKISEFGVSERLEPGETTDIEFIADQKGTFSLVCSFLCGSGHGSMTGELIVS